MLAPQMPAAAPEEPTRILGAQQPVQPVQVEPTRVVGAAPVREAEPRQEAAEPTRILDAETRARFPGDAARSEADDGTRVVPAAARRAQPAAEEPEEDDEETYEDERDSVAEALIRWVPPITAILCAGVALCGFIYYQFVL